MGAREVGRLGATTLGTNGSSSSISKLKRLVAALATSFDQDRYWWV